MMSGLSTAAGPVAFGDSLLRRGREDDRIVVLIGDLGRYVDVGAFGQAFPDRLLQMGMSEANIIGAAAGLAKSGLLPIVVTYGVFIARRAYDQVAMSLATGPTRVALVGCMPGISTPFRATHQAIDDVALMRAVPTMTVVDPADAVDLHGALRAAGEADGPLYVRAYRGSQPALSRPRGDERFALGRAVELEPEGEVAFLSSGLATQWVIEARAELHARGVESAHLHVPTIKPLDHEAVGAFCERHRVVVTVENASTVGGLGEAVAGVAAGGGLGTRVVRTGVPDVWPPSGRLPYIREQLGLDAAGLAALALDTRGTVR
ncbi:transketolase family protein [Conexibacter sp. CPCC 206217]|uniref:transketolase family protein n=1 Tax=Conexibacter sp. CPCC 206217 TaxID=3064574 RepID=UPI002728A78A|nr:transketolase C-terminal domain-containing protein [Conexibacter sp. CPCC 206217]MDO8209601.1 transketolase C-terminal domain-containing protein [Conexibacter sp. CPCC 206217]